MEIGPAIGPDRPSLETGLPSTLGPQISSPAMSTPALSTPALSTPALFRDCASALRCTLMQSRGPSMAFQTCQAALGNPSTALTVLESKPGVSVQGQAIMGPMTTPQHGLTCKSTRTARTRIPSAHSQRSVQAAA